MHIFIILYWGRIICLCTISNIIAQSWNSSRMHFIFNAGIHKRLIWQNIFFRNIFFIIVVYLFIFLTARFHQFHRKLYKLFEIFLSQTIISSTAIFSTFRKRFFILLNIFIIWLLYFLYLLIIFLNLRAFFYFVCRKFKVHLFFCIQRIYWNFFTMNFFIFRDI